MNLNCHLSFKSIKTMPLSIFDTHTQILGVIPASKKLLIDELCSFVKTVQPRHADKKYTYSDYLHILLNYIPRRPLANNDPGWMWDCQEVFSRGFLPFVFIVPLII